MKKFLPALLVLFSLAGTAQENTTVYKADSWLDLKKHVSAMRAMKTPVKETAKVTQSENTFKVSLGKTVYTYTIDSSSRFSEGQMRYHTTRNGKYYLLSVTTFRDGIYSIAADNDKEAGEWMLYPATLANPPAAIKPAGTGQ